MRCQHWDTDTDSKRVPLAEKTQSNVPHVTYELDMINCGFETNRALFRIWWEMVV